MKALTTLLFLSASSLLALDPAAVRFVPEEPYHASEGIYYQEELIVAGRMATEELQGGPFVRTEELNGDGEPDLLVYYPAGMIPDEPYEPYPTLGFFGVLLSGEELRGPSWPVLRLPHQFYVQMADIDGEGGIDFFFNGRQLNIDGNIKSGYVLNGTEVVERETGNPTGIVRDLNGDGTIEIQSTRADGELVWLYEGFMLRESDPRDTDSDGFSDWHEAQLGTDVLNPDTDGDGLPDGWEVARGRDPLVADVGYFDELKTQAFPGGEPAIAIGRGRSVTVTGLYPVEGVQIVVQVSADLQEWRDGGSAEDAVSGRLQFQAPLPTGFVRISVRE